MAIIFLCVAMVVSVGALVGVYAASTQNYKTGFNINYSVGDNIAAKVTGYYQYEGSEKVLMGDVQFNANDSTSGSMTAPDLQISPEVNKVRFIYSIENLAQSQFYFSATWEDLQINIDSEGNVVPDVGNENNKNVCIAFDIYPTLAEVPAEFQPSNCVNAPSFNELVDNSLNSQRVCVLTISVSNVNRSAYCHSDINGGLVLYLTSAN